MLRVDEDHDIIPKNLQEVIFIPVEILFFKKTNYSVYAGED